MFYKRLILFSIGHCCGFDTLNIHDNCDRTINSYAGELTYKFDSLSRNKEIFERECRVSVKLRSSLFTSNTHVLFYFTKVDIFPTCKEGNITIFAGDNKMRIKGLPKCICGDNKELEHSANFFTTLSDKLTVIIHTNITEARYGQFKMKYILFSYGPCNSADVYKCSNGRCISNIYRCSSQINACMAIEAVCNGTRNSKPNGSTLNNTNKFQQKLSLVVIIVMMAIITVCFYRRKTGACKCRPNPRPDATNQGRGWGPTNIHSNSTPDEQVPLSNTNIYQSTTVESLTVDLDNSLNSEQVYLPSRYMLAITYPDNPPSYEDAEYNNNNNNSINNDNDEDDNDDDKNCGDDLPGYGAFLANPSAYTNISHR